MQPLQACKRKDYREMVHTIPPKVRCLSRATVGRELPRLNARFVRRCKTYFSSSISFIYVCTEYRGGAMLRNVLFASRLEVIFWASSALTSYISWLTRFCFLKLQFDLFPHFLFLDVLELCTARATSMPRGQWAMKYTRQVINLTAQAGSHFVASSTSCKFCPQGR